MFFYTQTDSISHTHPNKENKNRFHDRFFVKLHCAVAKLEGVIVLSHFRRAFDAPRCVKPENRVGGREVATQ